MSSSEQRRTYAQKLKDARWQKARLRLLNAAQWSCEECGLAMPEDGLQVHHIVYLAGVEPWDYPDELLMVLCEPHHKERQEVERQFFAKAAQAIRYKSIEELKQAPVWWMFETRRFLAREERGQ